MSARMPSILRLNSSRSASAWTERAPGPRRNFSPRAAAAARAFSSFRRRRRSLTAVSMRSSSAPERGIVRRRRGVVDDRGDVVARDLRLPIDVGVEGLEGFQMRRVARFVRRILHLGDDHLPQRQRALERVDVQPRQIAIGGTYDRSARASRCPTRAAITIDRMEVTTASTIRPAAMPTIFCLIEFRNIQRISDTGEVEAVAWQGSATRESYTTPATQLRTAPRAMGSPGLAAIPGALAADDFERCRCARKWRAASASRRPGLVVAGRLGAAAGGKRRARGPVGAGRAGQVRHMRLFPLAGRVFGLGRRDIGRCGGSSHASPAGSWSPRHSRYRSPSAARNAGSGRSRHPWCDSSDCPARLHPRARR